MRQGPAVLRTGHRWIPASNQVTPRVGELIHRRRGTWRQPGARVSGPHPNSEGTLVVEFFTDPEGPLVGLAAAG